jgi:hypothetical protein
MITDIFLWLVPLFVFPASWLFYTFIPLRKLRYSIYAFFLAGAFILDLYTISFRSGRVDTGISVMVSFIVAEYFWNVRRIAKGNVFNFLFIIAIGFWGAYYWRWVAMGPLNGRQLWEPTVLSTFKPEQTEYRVVDSDLFDPLHPARDIKLLKQTGSFPVEKLIKTYRTPQGYYRTQYTCKWSITSLGVKVDLYDKDRKEWTLGEGL